MPPCRTEQPRRSHRLSKQTPKAYDKEGYEMYDLELFNQKYSSESTASSYAPHLPQPPSESPSTASSYDERPPHLPRSTKARKHDEDHIPRPSNAFMIFRSNYWALQKNNPTERDHRQISRLAAASWNKLSEKEKAPWRRLALIRKEEHARANPGYKYSPGSRKSEAQKKNSKKAKSNQKKGVVRSKPLAEYAMSGLNLEGLVSCSPEQTPTPSEPSPSSSVQVKQESPQTSLASLPVHNELPSSVPASQAQVAGEQAFGDPSLLSNSFEAEAPLELHKFSLMKIEDEEDANFVPTRDIPPLDLPAPAVVLPAMKAVAAPVEETEPRSLSPRIGSPTLPTDREIDSRFGYRPQIYNLDPQQTISTTPGGYIEVSSFANHEHHGPFIADTDVPMLSASYQYEHFNFGYGEVAGTITHLYQPSYPSISEGNPFNEGFLHDLAQSNPCYRFD
ncbi:hypothetical protein L218DRAFT_659936 [Marasmius fiardii PR-910]|nr:hypothetical protein L218DRAFT_659936 [Marasmius fiardii PR-910]